MKKPLGIGVEEYQRIIDKPYYYVDKTLMIKEILDKGGSGRRIYKTYGAVPGDFFVVKVSKAAGFPDGI